MPAETLQTATDLLKQHFGFDDFRPGQAQVVESLAAGRSALAVFPTGGGKSLCYQLPALMFDGVTLVVSPLIALMKDQIDFLQRRGIAAARLDSSLTLDETLRIGDDLASGALKLLYVAPERFNNERFLAQIARSPISLFAIDEAHCISSWGHNFRPDYLKLADAARDIGAARVLALTATATPQVIEDIQRAFHIATEDSIVTGFYRHNLRLATTPVTAAQRDQLLVRRVSERTPGPTIVYVTLQKTAERLANRLASAGFPAEAYHAGLNAEIRPAVQERWMQSESGIVVATIAFGMGIDKADVRYVYHYNLPKSLESYSQEIGRAGRDGQPSIVEMLCCPGDVPTLENFTYGDTPTREALRDLIESLLSREAAFDVSPYELSNLFDLRPLVLRTALTYLELADVIKQGTPFYAAYEFRLRPGATPETARAAFTGATADTIAAVFRVAKRGTTWFSLNPDHAAESTGAERGRIIRSLELLQERQFIELRCSEARQRYARLTDQYDTDELADTLYKRFSDSETAEIERTGMVLDLVTHAGCQTNYLVGYFGQVRDEPCGHCTFCKLGQPRSLPPLPVLAPIADTISADDIKALRRAHPEALGAPRQTARFLCGLTSPALTKAKLSRHPLFGRLEERSFIDVLQWIETAATPSDS